MKFPWNRKKAVEQKQPEAAVKKARKKRKPQAIFGRVCVEGAWFEQRADGVYVRQLYGRKWQRVSFTAIRDLANGQLPLITN